jgi:hypothetical protein
MKEPEWLKHTLFELVQTLPNVHLRARRKNSDETS